METVHVIAVEDMKHLRRRNGSRSPVIEQEYAHESSLRRQLKEQGISLPKERRTKKRGR